ncbi:hypothetical protein V0R50_26835 [Pseudomonas sp. 148P]|uniref:Uncharacterized protein n=1 Tax=Pseudomonas ulcerans TaxID=3115852 RepID=A0ABU7HZ52_9PSED|nr:MULTISPECIES: hypothetical protein [unclassified Pseudomonas]MEE1925506.1 hypothetical protein [Pseudomonas sp. 147P]MEE1936855.1 hypothetical protein [Pseudomonas sp. 148P]
MSIMVIGSRKKGGQYPRLTSKDQYPHEKHGLRAGLSAAPVPKEIPA